MNERKYWNEAMETMSPEQIKVLQFQKLKKQMKYCYDNSPLYFKKKFDEAGASPEDIKTWEDYRKLPIMGSKDMERESQKESLERFGHSFGLHLCAPIEKVIGVTSTSGTTGVPTFSYLFTKKDLEVNNEIWARIYWRAGIRPGHIAVNLFAQSMHAAGWPVNLAIRSMGACPIPVGAEAGSQRILHMINMTKPFALVGTPALMEHLIERCPEILRKEVGALGIKRIVCTGAPGAGIPEVRRKIEEAYGCKLFDSIGGGQGCHQISCDSKVYQGMHVVTADYIIWAQDIVDPDTKEPLEIKNGVVGEGITSALEQEATPMFRYSYGDLIQVFTQECECGQTGWRIKVVGRADEMLIVKGVNVFPSAIKGVVNSFFPEVTGELRVVLDEPGPMVAPPLKIKVEYGQKIDKSRLEVLKKEIEEELHKQLEFRGAVELLPPGTLERAGGLAAKGALIEKRYEKK